MTTAKTAAKKAFKNIAHVKAAKTAKAAGSGSSACSIIGVYARMAKLVITGFFISIGEHFVCFIDLFKGLFCFFITRV